jgi:paraquat-inducible protein A
MMRRQRCGDLCETYSRRDLGYDGRAYLWEIGAGTMTLGGRRFLLSLAIVAASVCLALGVSLPIIKLTKFVFFTYEHSLISTVNALIRSGQLFLGITVLVFSIVLPVTKLLYLLLLSTLPQRELKRLSRQLRALEWLGKWSMHDVLVLSLSIFFIKSQGVYDARSLNGVYFFTAAVLFMILAYAWLRTDVGAAEASNAAANPAPAPSIPGRPQQPPSTLRNFAFSFLIILATVFFALGVMLPAIRFTTVFVWTNQHSVATIIWALWQNEEFFLCFVIFMFSIFFPFLKLFYLLTLVTSPDMPAEFRNRSISAMEWLGRYSMTDVMVLALMIFYINASGYSEASVLPGIYFFAASAIMTMLAYGWANSVTPGLAPKPVSLQARLANLASPTGEPRQRAS